MFWVTSMSCQAAVTRDDLRRCSSWYDPVLARIPADMASITLNQYFICLVNLDMNLSVWYQQY
jgi:hypothetical protein